MKRSSKVIKIKKAEYVGNYTLKLLFSDGITQQVDFEPFLRNSYHPEIQKYLQRKYFKNYSFNDGKLMWGDFDLIFPDMDLYNNSIESRAS